MDIEKDMQREDNMKTHTKKMPCDQSDAPANQGMPRIVDKHKKLEEGRKDSALEALEGEELHKYLDFRPLASRSVRE